MYSLLSLRNHSLVLSSSAVSDNGEVFLSLINFFAQIVSGFVSGHPF